MSSPVLLVVAHGSRDPRHAATVHALTGRVRALRPGVRVETGFLEFNAPSVPRVLERLAMEGARDVVTLPCCSPGPSTPRATSPRCCARPAPGCRGCGSGRRRCWALRRC
ncbi:hypothetical protein Sfulv_49050 [Streptomyces fulvorobeus]|uniref:Cobalamin biosynthesis protein CbiX n=1 Tax=Streptomyces fulvorobeus TaxID=284028 RepID=A0A7J0CE77_9ACTN|nr:hypothetical protein Sfulv_49050 [Streptomyces fulvorobeus]